VAPNVTGIRQVCGSEWVKHDAMHTSITPSKSNVVVVG